MITNKKIGIVSLQGIGNTILLLPFIKALIEHKNEITLIVSNNGSNEIVKCFFSSAQCFLIIWDEQKSNLHNIINIYKKTYPLDLEYIYGAYPHGKRVSLLVRLIKANKKRILQGKQGYFKLLRFLNSYKRNFPFDLLKHDVCNNSKLFGIPVDSLDFEAFKCRGNKNKLSIGIHIGGSHSSKLWNMEKFAELMSKLGNDFSCDFTIIVGPGEDHLIESLKSYYNKSFIQLIGEPFPVLIQYLKNLSLLIGHDSSIGHLSNLIGVPVISIWSYAQYSRTSTFGKGNLVIKKDYSCIPCHQITYKYINTCKYNLRCIKTLSIDNVYKITSKYFSLLVDNISPSSSHFRDLNEVSNVEILESGCIVISVID